MIFDSDELIYSSQTESRHCPQKNYTLMYRKTRIIIIISRWQVNNIIPVLV